MANFTTADRIGGIGGYIGGISTLLGMANNGGLLGGLVNGGNNRSASPTIIPMPVSTCNCDRNATCSENVLVNRYEAGLSAEIERLRTEVSLRDANTFTQSQLGQLRDYVDNRFTAVEHEICDQKVFNATAISNISCIQGQIAQLYGLTKLVVPNSSICPGWGNVTITPSTTATTG